MNSDPYWIVITGEREDLASSFPARHSKTGRPLEWHSLPLLQFEKLPLDPGLLSELENEPVNWILFTSSRAVNFFFETMKEQGRTLPTETQIACIGEQTARLVAKFGIDADFYPTEPGTEKFLEEFEDLLSNNTIKPSVFIPMAEGGRATIRERLAEVGCLVRWAPLYRTSAKSDLSAPPALSQADLVVFTSPSCVDIFLKNFSIPASAKVGAIGNFTAAALDRHAVRDWTLLPEGNLRRAEEMLP